MEHGHENVLTAAGLAFGQHLLDSEATGACFLGL